MTDARVILGEQYSFTRQLAATTPESTGNIRQQEIITPWDPAGR
jgi:hypothetical protein